MDDAREPMSEQERLLLYQHHIDQISELKASQWRISREALLVQAALVTAVNLTLPKIGCVAVVGGAVFVVVCLVLAGSMLHQFQVTLAGRRKGVDWLAKRPRVSFHHAVVESRKGREMWRSWPWRWSDVLVLFLFGVVHVGGAFVAMMVILNL